MYRLNDVSTFDSDSRDFGTALFSRVSESQMSQNPFDHTLPNARTHERYRHDKQQETVHLHLLDEMNELLTYHNPNVILL